MWGALELFLIWVVVDRIIPTYVGSTNRQCAHCYRIEDHPYVCGEHALPRAVSKITSGSSLRMWGAR